MSITNLLEPNNYKLYLNDPNYNTNSLKGTLLVSNGAEFSELSPGSDGFVLTTDSSEPLGLKYVGTGGPAINIYDSNGTLDSDRIISTGGFDLNINGTGNISITGASTINFSSVGGGFKLNGLADFGAILQGDGNEFKPLSLGAPGTVLTSSAGFALWQPLPAALSNSYSELYLNDVSAVTTPATTGVFLKENWTGSLNGLFSADWTNTTAGDGNRMTYTSATTRLFQITCNLTFSCGAGPVRISHHINYNGTTPIVKSEQDMTVQNASQFYTVTLSALVNMNQNDFVEIWVANKTDTSPIVMHYATFTAVSI